MISRRLDNLPLDANRTGRPRSVSTMGRHAGDRGGRPRLCLGPVEIGPTIDAVGVDRGRVVIREVAMHGRSDGVDPRVRVLAGLPVVFGVAARLRHGRGLQMRTLGWGRRGVQESEDVGIAGRRWDQHHGGRGQGHYFNTWASVEGSHGMPSSRSASVVERGRAARFDHAPPSSSLSLHGLSAASGLWVSLPVICAATKKRQFGGWKLIQLCKPWLQVRHRPLKLHFAALGCLAATNRNGHFVCVSASRWSVASPDPTSAETAEGCDGMLFCAFEAVGLQKRTRRRRNQQQRSIQAVKHHVTQRANKWSIRPARRHRLVAITEVGQVLQCLARRSPCAALAPAGIICSSIELHHHCRRHQGLAWACSVLPAGWVSPRCSCPYTVDRPKSSVLYLARPITSRCSPHNPNGSRHPNPLHPNQNPHKIFIWRAKIKAQDPLRQALTRAPLQTACSLLTVCLLRSPSPLLFFPSIPTASPHSHSIPPPFRRQQNSLFVASSQQLAG